MKKLFFLLTVPLIALAAHISAAHAQSTCPGDQQACESEPGLGEEDDCCHCAATETMVDTDGNGFFDSCESTTAKDANLAPIVKDPCHGQYNFTDTSFNCDGLADTCCRVPSKRALLNFKDPCHGQEAFMDTCPADGFADSCCVVRKIRIQK